MRRGIPFVVTLFVLATLVDASEVRQRDGTTVQFEVVRSSGGAASTLAEGVIGDDQGVHRLLVDELGRKYFGYTVKVSGGQAGGYLVAVGPLGRAQQAKFTDMFGPTVGSPEAIQYPAPQEVRPGEPLLFELLVDPSTGEKLSDLIRVQAPSKSDTAAKAAVAAHQTGIQLVDVTMKINGLQVPMRSSAAPAKYVYLFTCDRGLFVATTEPVPGVDFFPATLKDAKTLAFEHVGNRYEWIGQGPFVPRSSPIWVWRDPDFRCRPGTTSGHGAGADFNLLLQELHR
jgi:hypothetical protein